MFNVPFASLNDMTTVVDCGAVVAAVVVSKTLLTLPSPRCVNMSFPNLTSEVPDKMCDDVYLTLLSKGAKQDCLKLEGMFPNVLIYNDGFPMGPRAIFFKARAADAPMSS